MRDNLEAIIWRAQTLLGTRQASSDFVVIKLRPEPSACCCSGCWPEAWAEVNRDIAPAGPVPHEGNALVEIDGGHLVIEGHESGPEFVTALAVVSGSITVLRTIIDLVLLFVRARPRRRGSVPVRLHLELRRIRDGTVSERTLTIELPPSDDLQSVLEQRLKETLAQVQANVRQ